MTYKPSSAHLWILAFVFMAAIAIYQRTTGPTYPIKGKAEIANQKLTAKLLTTSDSEGDAIISINAADTSITGTYTFKRFKSRDEWTSLPLKRDGEKLLASLPHQPPAGKVEYQITLTKGNEQATLNEKPVVLRYKGKVPAFVLIPHVILMFLAMVFSTRAGLEALTNRGNSFRIAIWTTVFLLLGGLILGPLVQQYAFGAYWTGWPLGHDLTDNKTAIAFIAWIVALIRLRKNPGNRGWVLVASIILLAIYLIPHSVLGSEIDYTNE